MNDWPIRQVAYAVPDPVEAARRHSAIYGSGPFFRADHVPVREYRYRGEPGEFDHSITIGQWGDLMIEFFVQHNEGASHVRDLFPERSDSQGGFHHVAIIPTESEAAIARFTEMGFEVASSFVVGNENGFEVAMIDTRAMNGHMIEIYADCEPVRAAYALCREAAASGADRSVIQSIDF